MRAKIVALFLILTSGFSSSPLVATDFFSEQRPGTHQTKGGVMQEGNCRHCHAETSTLRTDISKPECQECHGTQPTLPSYPVPVAEPQKEEIIEQEMVLIPEGPFIMGNPGRPAAEGEGNPDEGPPHEVFVKAFYMDLYETTNAHYKRYVDATQSRPPLHWRRGKMPAGKINHPVVYVNWQEANAFCHWNGKRLPTEEEWEKAARGTDQRHFPWGIQFDVNRANTPQYSLSRGIEVADGGTMPVGSFENGKSPYGLYDMAGNVYEWTSTWYLPYPGNRVHNIHYGRKNKVLRGGSWYNCMSYGCGLSSPVYNRTRFTPEIKNKGFGFRCASDQKK